MVRTYKAKEKVQGLCGEYPHCQQTWTGNAKRKYCSPACRLRAFMRRRRRGTVTA